MNKQKFMCSINKHYPYRLILGSPYSNDLTKVIYSRDNFRQIKYFGVVGEFLFKYTTQNK
jgi:hypothetical protein